MRVIFRPSDRPNIPAPPGVRVIDSGFVGGSYREAPTPPEMIIVRRWFSPVALLLSLFSAFWAVFLWTVASMPGVATLILPLGLPMGLGLIYWALCGLLNRTTVVVRSDTLEVRHGPVPWAWRLAIPIDMVDHFVCEERVSSAEHPGLNDTLSVVRTDGRKLALLTHVAEPAHVMFVKQCLDRCLQRR
jgi:hypothetical protein